MNTIQKFFTFRSQKSKFHYLLLLLFCINITNSFSQTVISDTAVSGTWTKSGSPYYIDTNIYVANYSTLVIEPGVEVIFRGHYMLTVEGTLHAVGTTEDTIVFSIDDTTGFNDYNNWDGSWYGIYFNQSNEFNDTSKIIHCKLEYINTVRDDLENWEQKHAAIHVYFFDRLVLKNSIIRKTYSKRGGALHCGYSHITIENNLFIENSTFDGGGALYFTRAFPTIQNNIICNNYCTTRGGGIYSIESSLKIIQNIIANNYAEYGGGCSFEKSNNTLINNTITNNEGGSRYGGFRISAGQLKFINNIIWGNEETSGSDDQVNLLSIPVIDFYNNVIEGGFNGVAGEKEASEDYNNIGLSPDFINPTSGIGTDYKGYLADWYISISSSAINNGTLDIDEYLIPSYDLNHKERINLNKIDVGAYEFHKDTLIITEDITTNTTWAADTVKIFDNITVNCTKLKILPGVVVEMQGWYLFTVDGTVEAIGTEENPILFTINDTTGFMNFEDSTGAWKGICFPYTNSCLDASDTSIFKHCIIEYGKKFVDFEDNGGAFDIDGFSKIKIENCELRNNYADWGGAIKTGRCFLTLKNLVIHNNYSKTSNIYNRSSSNINFINCNISNNYSNGDLIRVGENSQINIIGCSITNNEKGIYFYFSSSEIINSTICNNGGYHTFSSSPVLLKNTIFWDDNFSIDGANAEFINSNILNGYDQFANKANIISFDNILDSTPFFINPSKGESTHYDGLNADWSLMNISPCINAGDPNTETSEIPGKDIAGNTRINSTYIDIGAYENQGGTPVITKQPFCSPICENDSIQFIVETSDTANFTWLKDGKTILTGSNILSLNTVTPENQGNYSCLVSNSYGNIQSSTNYLTIKQKPYILNNPLSVDICKGEDIQLDVSVTGAIPINYQWKKDSNIIIGANENIFTKNSVDTNDSGHYYCKISNECGTIFSDTVPVVIHKTPEPSIGNDTTLCAYSGYTLDPGNYSQYEWNDYSVSRIKDISQSGNYYVKVTDGTGCVGYSDSVNITVNYPYSNEQICLVTVDTVTNKNMVIWEKTENKGIIAYNIYRQSGFNFDLIATIPYDSTTIYIDQKSKPNERAARYAISVIDTCGNESGLSPFHQTIHLGSSLGAAPGTIVLDWTDYIDESNAFIPEYYYIYRGKSKDSLALKDSVSSIYTEYNDLAPQGALYYQIGVKKDIPCDPNNLLKISSGPFSQAISNLEDNRLKENNIWQIESNQYYNVYPNPASEYLFINIKKPGKYWLKIINSSGKTVYKHESSDKEKNIKINIQNFPSGMYILQFSSEKTYIRSKIVIY